MSRLLLVALMGTAVSIMWAISALANFIHGYTKGGGGDPFGMLAQVLDGHFETINYMALLFGSGSIASDMIKATALILAGMAVGYRRWGVAALALCLWLPAQIYSAYSVTGFVSQVMGDAIAQREAVAQRAQIYQQTAKVDVERLSWLSKQSVDGVGPSARRSRAQFADEYEKQRDLAQASAKAFEAAPLIIAPDAAADLWQYVLSGWSAKDISMASMIGLSIVIEMVAGLGFFLISKASTMHRKPPSAAPASKSVAQPPLPVPAPGEPDAAPVPEPEIVLEPQPSNVIDLGHPPRHLRAFRSYLQAEVDAGRIKPLPPQSDVCMAYRRYCKTHGVAEPVRTPDLPDLLSSLGIKCSRAHGERSRRLVYDIRRAA